MQERDWYYAKDAETVGPFTRVELVGKLAELQGAQTLVYGPGFSDWQPAGEVPELTAVPVEPPPRPSPVLWLVYLFFRPRRFFQHFVVDATPGLTVLCAWIYGMTGVMDSLEGWQPDESRVTGWSWPTYWTVVVVGGVLAGALYFSIGGWWYKVRLAWSGAVEPAPALARRVYLFAAQVLTIPQLVAAVVATSMFESPETAEQTKSAWFALPLLFLFWSCWTSYVGVRAAFVVRRGLAMLWFLILPLALYFIIAVGVGLLLVLGFFSGPADVENPDVYDSRSLHFSYPGNWFIGDYEGDFDPNTNVYVEPFADAYAHIMIYESEQGLEEEIAATVAEFDETFTRRQALGEFSAWGVYEGAGVNIAGNVERSAYRLRVFVGELPDGRLLEAREFYEASLEHDVTPGFELIRNTLRVKPGSD